MSGSSIPVDVMKAAAEACRAHGVAPMEIPFVPSTACFVAITAIMQERARWTRSAGADASNGQARS